MNELVRKLQIAASLQLLKACAILGGLTIIVVLATGLDGLLALAVGALLMKIVEFGLSVKQILEIRNVLSGANIHIVGSKEELEKTIKDLGEDK